MHYQTNDFDYQLPKNCIAQTPIEPREKAKLMALDKATKTITHAHIYNLPSFFQQGDVIILNNSKVFKSRLFGTLEGFQKKVELFLIRPLDDHHWLALAKPGKHFHIGSIIHLSEHLDTTVTEKHPDGTITVAFPLSSHDIIQKTATIGSVPIPPYIKTIPKEEQYQTSYAKIVGSVAAPTAGFHLTPNIRKQLEERGVTILEITLHVGLGTFLPIKTDTLEEHHMHSEWVDVSDHVATTVMKAKKNHQRIIAIGTTTVRTLEGIALLHNGVLTAYQGDINCFITPGFHFSIIDGMLTNFHLPKSTLMILVSAFAGIDFIKQAYQEAINQSYRFYSFGDAMLIT